MSTYILENIMDIFSPAAHAYVDRARMCYGRTSSLWPARGGRVMTMAKRTVKSAAAHH